MYMIYFVTSLIMPDPQSSDMRHMQAFIWRFV